MLNNFSLLAEFLIKIQNNNDDDNNNNAFTTEIAKNF